MVSVNGAISVDLTGQVVAESFGPKQYSNVGDSWILFRVLGEHVMANPF